MQGLRDTPRRSGRLVCHHADRIFHAGAGQVLEIGRHRGRKQQRLALFRQCLQDLVDLRRKPHIQHAVRFVQYQDLDGDEVDRAVPHVIQQAARRRDNDLRVLAQATDLGVHISAADDRRGKDAPGAAEFIDRLLGLNRQLTSRGQDQRQRMALRRSR